MNLTCLALALALAVSGAPALAQNNPGGAGVGVLKGKCSKLVLGGEDLSRGCRSEVASVTLADGTVVFVFSTRGKMVGFQGDGRTVRPGPRGTGVLPVRFVSVGPNLDSLDVTRANGTCQFSDPYAGQPATIECSAKSQFGTISGSFRSNGRPPL